MKELVNIIDSRINKNLNNNMSLKSTPCEVVKVFDNNNVKVRLISNGAEYTVGNYSGSQVLIGETVQLFYKGIITQNSAYIGASLYKEDGNSEINDSDISLNSTWSSRKINDKINELQNQIDDIEQSAVTKATSGITELQLNGTDVYAAGKTVLVEEEETE